MMENSAIDSFLDFYLSRTTYNMELRSIPTEGKPVKQLFTRDKNKVSKFIEKHKKNNLYFGAASRNGNKNGTAENAREVIFLWADLDFKYYTGGEAEARAQIASFKLKPSIVVHSGNGLHAYWMLTEPIQNAYESREQVKGALLGIAEALKGDTQVCDIARVMRLPGSVNYKNENAKTVKIEEWDIAAATPLSAFVSLKNSCSNKNKNVLIREDDALFDARFTEGFRNSSLFHIANCLTRGSAKRGESLQVLRILAKNCTPPFPEDEIETIIQSALDRKVRGEAGLTEDIKRIISVSDGIFCVSDIVKAYQEHQNISSASNSIKSQIRTIIIRLKESGFIQKEGSRDGVYRRVITEWEEIDILSAPVDSFPIVWPFQVEAYVKTHPKNIIVVAGSPNSGKTAFLLNTVAMNMDKHKINYFSSEMETVELTERLSHFNDISLADFKKKVKWIKCAGNFSDAIRPNEVNIVDFLELTRDFYLVAEYIRNIYEKLTTGIAIIAIQKNPGLALGLGGVRSLEKARLYLTLDNHILKIEKGKNWTEPTINPNGLEIRFKLVQGCHFIGEGQWTKKDR